MAVLKGSNILGTYLSELLSSRMIDKKYFSTSLDINRTQLYRFLKGEQLPEIELIHKIAFKLNLRASEYDKLLESYDCSAYGLEVIQGRKIIYNIIDNLINHKSEDLLSISYSPENQSQFAMDINSETSQIIPIQGKNKVLHATYALLDSIKKHETKIRILMQPDNEGLLTLLPSIIHYISKNRINSGIEHIIRFKDITNDRNKLYNLQIFEKLLPYAGNDDIYNVYYTVGNYDTVTYDAFFPNLICLDNKKALMISADFQNALYISNADSSIVSLMCTEFDKILGDSLPMFYKVSDVFDMSKYMLEYEAPAKTDTYLLHPEHIFYTFPLSLIEEMAMEHKLHETITKLFINRANAFRKRLKKNHAYEIITITGIDNFVQTGILLIQGSVYFNISQRIEILESLVDYVENNHNYNLAIMREDNPFIDIDSAVYIIDEELLFIVPSYTKFSIEDNIIIREKGIIDSFKDFFISYYTEKNCITDRKAVAAIIKDKINLLHSMQ